MTKLKLANPWWMVLGAALSQVFGQGPIIQFTFGVFLKPISREFGFTRGGASVALTLGLTLCALCVPVAGRLMDRFGVTRVALLATAAFGLGVMALSLAQSAAAFITLYAVVGVFATGQSPLPYTKTISMVFDRRRGLALSLALTGVGLGTVAVPQLAQRLVDGLGWRVAYLGIGLLVLAIALPILAFVVGPHAKPRAGVPAADAVGVSAREARRDPRLYLLASALFLAAAAANGTIAHIAPLLTDRGIPTAQAVGALGLVGGASIVGRVIAGFALDRIAGGLVAALFLLAAAAGVLILAFAPGLPWMTAAVILLGLGLGAEADLVGFLIARYFGTRAFGELFGYMFGTFLLASSFGPALMGLWFDRAGSYVPCLSTFAVALVVASVLFQGLGRYAYGPPTALIAH